MRILVVEDSVRLRNALVKGLTAEGHAVDGASDGRQGLICAQTSSYDVIVLDLMLPQMDGIELLKKLRELDIDVHVLILSAKDTTENRIHGLRTGADDYLVKPFSFDELLARIAALGRRRYNVKSPTLDLGMLSINTLSRRASVDGDIVDLTKREYALLEYLAFREGSVVTRAQLEEHLYDGEHQPWSNAIDSAVSAIRKKLKQAGMNTLIQTRRGIGYCIELEGIDEAHQESINP